VLANHAVYDDLYVLSSPDLHCGWTEWAAEGAWHDVWGSRLNGPTSNQQWRPLAVASLRLSLALRPGCAAAGAAPLLATRDACDAPPHACLAALHGDTLALHALCAALLYWAAAGPLRAPAAEAALGAALFALHPAHAESVATVYGRADVVALALQLSSLLLAWRWRRAAGAAAAARLLSALLLAAAAALCKENAVPVALALPLADWLLWPSQSTSKAALALASSAAVAGGLLLRRASLQPWGPPTGFVDNPAAFLRDAGARRASLAWLNVRYLLFLLGCGRQAVNHGWDSGTLILPPAAADPRAAAALAVHCAAAAALLALAWAAARRPAARPPLFLALWGLLAFAPAANAAFVVGTTLGERLLYLPSAPFCLLAARALRLAAAAAPPRAAAAAAALALAAVAQRCRSELAPYRCEQRLWAANAQRYPRNVLALNNLAVRFDTVGLHADALPLYDAIEAVWAAGEAGGHARLFRDQQRAWGVAENAMRRGALGRARVLRPLLAAAAVDAGWAGGRGGAALEREEAAATAMRAYVEALNGQPDAALAQRILARLRLLCDRWDAGGLLPLCREVRK